MTTKERSSVPLHTRQPDHDIEEQDRGVSSVPAGYAKLYQSLWDLHMLEHGVATRGVLLWGSPGVGKTFLVSRLAHQLHHKYSSGRTDSPPVWDIEWFTMNDILLRATSVMATSDEILQWLLEPLQQQRQSSRISSSSNTQQQTPRHVLFVLDDLHLLEQVDDSDPSQIGVNVRNVQAALSQWLEIVFASRNDTKHHVIGMTRQIQNLPTSLTAVNLLDIHLEMDSPSLWQRRDILQHLLMQLSLEQPKAANVDNRSQVTQWGDWLAERTAGCVASDLVRLCTNAQLRAQARDLAQREEEEGQNDESTHHETRVDNNRTTLVSWNDLVQSTQSLVPSQLQQLDVIPPPLTLTSHQETNRQTPQESWYAQHEASWSSFAGYTTLKRRIYRTLVLPWRRIQQMQQDESGTWTAMPPPRGVIFHGPSGCGKTMAATCLGASLGLPMIRVRAADILDKWLGGSEATLRLFFEKARNAAPCILFLDELDAIATNRQDSDDGDGASGGVMSRLLSTFLNEMDGVSSTAVGSGGSGGVLVVACTNRMDRLDAALLRPGRLEEHVEIPLPTIIDASDILNHYFSTDQSLTEEGIDVDQKTRRSLFVSKDVNLEELAKHLVEQHQATGASMEGLAREAVLRCIRKRKISGPGVGGGILPLVSSDDVQMALEASHLA
uniref:AAA+ ATPase domain-containing protein n=1 Tax=Entomoneis paludosa TaxID=265537 RepID=A0A6U3BMV8_9STRA|mmetsp:Transcript_31292/g.65273  ORF Transcript_31292/g.65273 Transcript_31292/m.65273 type:complete len:667 (+) Transcript_31292:137-2137(+)